MQIYGIKTPSLTLSQVFHVNSLAQTDFSSVPWKPYTKAAASCLPMWKLCRGRSDSQLTASWQTFLAVLWQSSLCSPELLARHTSPLFPYHLDTYTGNQNTVSWVVKVSKSVSSSRKVQLIPYSLDNDTPTQIISPLTKWRRIWQILTVTSPSEVGPKVNSPYNHSP